MATKKFLRRTSNRYSKLGLRRKRKQVWRRPTGRDNKMREKRRGYPAIVSVGHKGNKNEREKIEGKETVIVNNLNDLEKVKKNEIIMLGNLGKKKKLEVLKKAKKEGLHVYGVNIDKFLKQNEKPKKESKENKTEGKRK